MIRRRQFLYVSLSAAASQAFAIPISNDEDSDAEVHPKIGSEDTGTDFLNEVRFAATFKAFVDTLLPADEFSPAASSLAVDTEMLDAAFKNHGYKRLIYQGCEWLNAAARYEGNRGGKFATLSYDARARIIEVAETTGNGKAGPARFVRTTLTHANQVYYSRPQVWQSLAYTGPPQPHGFSDYQKPFNQSTSV